MSCERCNNQPSLLHRNTCPSNVRHPRFARNEVSTASHVIQSMMQNLEGKTYVPDYPVIDGILQLAIDRSVASETETLTCAAEKEVIAWVRKRRGD